METPIPATVCSKIVVRTHHSGDKLWVCRVDPASPHGRHAFVHGHSARKFIERSVLVAIMLLHEQLATSLPRTTQNVYKAEVSVCGAVENNFGGGERERERERE